MNQNQQDIDEHLLLQYLLGNAEEELHDRVDAWLNADIGNRKHLDRLESLWLETGKLSAAPVAVDTDAAWIKITTRIDQYEKRNLYSHQKTSMVRYMRWAIGAAAVILLFLGVYAIVRLLKNNRTGNEVELVSTLKVVHATLPDGSGVALNKHSKLVYPERFKTETREFKLTGEGFFDVTMDHSQPFVICAGAARIKVLGTTFHVVAYPGCDISVSVTEGQVLFFTVDPDTEDTLSVILEAGSSAILKTGSRRPEMAEESAPDDLFWANQTLDFRRTSLSEVFSLIEKYYSVKITVSDPAILNCRLTASFENEHADRILVVIAESFGLELTENGQNFHLTGHGCSKKLN